MALKELEVRYATKRVKDYKLTDGEGLYLLVRASGSSSTRAMPDECASTHQFNSPLVMI